MRIGPTIVPHTPKYVGTPGNDRTLGRADDSPEMGTWGEAERVVQPTDMMSGRFSRLRVTRDREDREEDERDAYS